MKTKAVYLFIFISLCNVHWASTLKCQRTPEGHGALQTPADGRFHIRIADHVGKYTPGRQYTSKSIYKYKIHISTTKSNLIL